MSRSCDATGCDAAIAPGRFLCRRHWTLVPPEHQRTINSRYRSLRKDFAFLSDEAYLRACVEAIDGLSRVEGRTPQDGSYHRLLRVALRRNATSKNGGKEKS